MKLKIIKKTIKEGTSASGREYCIKSLMVVFNEPEVYEKIVAHLKAQGAPEVSILKFCSPREYKGETSYSFFLNCSGYTFDAVEAFGVLDAKIVFSCNDAGYVNAKIQVVDKVEQVTSYEGPEEFVSGWACPAPAPKKHDQPDDKPLEVVPAYQPPILSGFVNPTTGAPEIPTDGDGLPF